MISVNWATGVISVPQSYLTHLGGVQYELDVDQFRLDLKALEDDADGMPWPKTHDHVTESTLAGITFARQVQILSPYTVTFEDGQYTVVATGANHNIVDVLNPNQVSLVTQNSAGLIVRNQSTVAELAAAVWTYIVENGKSAEWMLRVLVANHVGNGVFPEGDGTFSAQDLAGSKNRIVGTVAGGVRTVTTRDGD